MDKGYSAHVARWRVPLGFVFGIAYLVFSHPTTSLLMIGGGIALVGLLIRAFAAGYLEKGRRLTTAGPYRFTRNPLYFGSFLMGSGFVMSGGSWWLDTAFLILFTSVYWPVMRREADTLRERFVQDYIHYEETTPLFLPSFLNISIRRGGVSARENFRWDRYRGNREYEAAFGYLVCVVILALKISVR